MLKKLKHISPALYAWSRLFFYLAIVLLALAVPVGFLGLLFYDFQATLGLTIAISSLVLTFYIAVQIGKRNSNPFR
jgi:hypothetical protein